MKFNIYSLTFLLLVQVLTPFVLISGTISQANKGMLLVCTQDGYQWINTDSDSRQAHGGDSGPSCPLCLINIRVDSNQLLTNFNVESLFNLSPLRLIKVIIFNIEDDQLNFKDFFFKDNLGRAPPLA